MYKFMHSLSWEKSQQAEVDLELFKHFLTLSLEELLNLEAL
jgi:hypothetical protein